MSTPKTSPHGDMQMLIATESMIRLDQLRLIEPMWEPFSGFAMVTVKLCG
jgi:hypothetical protein